MSAQGSSSKPNKPFGIVLVNKLAQTNQRLKFCTICCCLACTAAPLVVAMRYASCNMPEKAVRAQMRRKANNKANLSLKKWVDKQKINLITTCTTDDNSMWKMIVSQYKNYRLRGVDVTELSN
jgi:NADH:ubiquinone oxidoreductase subunit E